MGKSTDIEPGWGDHVSLENLSFQEMMDAGVISIDEIDDVVQCDQSELVGIPFILFEWDIKESQTFGGHYALCKVKVADGTRVFADGGVGIQEQLARYQQKMNREGIERQPLYFPHGLRKSDYMTEVDGKQIPATTYYLDNSVK